MPWGKFNRNQSDLRDYVSRLFTWRKGSKAATQGDFVHFRPDGRNVYVYFRTVKGEAVMTILNAGEKDYEVDWNHFSEITAKFAQKGKNVLTGERVRVDEPYVVAAGTAAILQFK